MAITSYDFSTAPGAYRVRHPGALHELLLGGMLFVLTFGPKLYGGLDLIAGTSVALIGYHTWRGRALGAHTTQFAALLVGLLAYSIALSIFGATGDLFFAGRAARALINFLGACVLFDMYRRAFGRAVIDHVLVAIFWVIAFHGLIMLLMFVFPEIGTRIYAVTLTVEPQASILVAWRTAGLTEGLGTTSVIQSLGLLIAPFLMVKPQGVGKRLAYLGGSLIILISILVSGRTGLALAMLFVPVATFLARRRPFKRSGSTHVTVLALVLLAAAAWSGYRMLPSDARLRFQFITLRHAFEGVFSILETGEFHIRSAEDVLEDQLIAPDQVWALVFGSGQSGREQGMYVPSDVGYVRFLFGLGLVGSLMTYAFYLLSLLYAARAGRVDARLAWITGLAIAGIMAAHAKTVLALTRNTFTITALLVACCIAASTMTRWEDLRRETPPVSNGGD